MTSISCKKALQSTLLPEAAHSNHIDPISDMHTSSKSLYIYGSLQWEIMGNHQLNLMSLLIHLSYQYIWCFSLSVFPYLPYFAFLPDSLCNMFFHFKDLFSSLATYFDKSCPAQR